MIGATSTHDKCLFELIFVIDDMSICKTNVVNFVVFLPSINQLFFVLFCFVFFFLCIKVDTSGCKFIVRFGSSPGITCLVWQCLYLHCA